jgi:tetratricopeptide (TPR) repeat protein
MSAVFMTLVILFCILGDAFATPTASSIAAADSYQKGLQLYQTQDFAGARDQFKLAWESEPASAWALYNWGLSEAKLGNAGMALAAWRRALYLNPDLSVAQRAIDFLLATTSLGAMNSGVNTWETFRSSILARFSMHQGVVVSLILLVAAGWILVRFGGQYRLAIEEEMPLPAVPWMGFVFGVLFLAAQTLSILKVYDHFQPRVTVIAASANVRSAPTIDGTPLFEIFAGAEVLLKRRESDWSQVKYPGGLTGWVENQNLFHTSGRELE